MKSLEFRQKLEKAFNDNFCTPPEPGENKLIFGEREQPLNPTLLNGEREKLGYRKKSIFDQCKWKSY